MNHIHKDSVKCRLRGELSVLHSTWNNKTQGKTIIFVFEYLWGLTVKLGLGGERDYTLEFTPTFYYKKIFKYTTNLKEFIVKHTTWILLLTFYFTTLSHFIHLYIPLPPSIHLTFLDSLDFNILFIFFFFPSNSGIYFPPFVLIYS